MKPPEMSAEDCRATLVGLGLTRTGLARLLGVDKDTLARAEKGEGLFAATYRLLLATLNVAYGQAARDARYIALCRTEACRDCEAMKQRMIESGARAAHERAVNDLADFLAGAADGRSRPRGKS